MNSIRNICIIPAKSNSVRLPGKNFKDFYGKPIIQYSIDAAYETSLFNSEDIIVSTDMIPDGVRLNNCSIMNRPDYLCDNETPMISVLKHVLNVLDDDNIKNVLMMYPCAPLTTSSILLDAYSNLVGRYSVVMPIIKNSFPNNQEMEISEMGNILTKNDHDNVFQEYRYHHAGAWFWLKSCLIKNVASIMDGVKNFIVLQGIEAQDVNNQHDWDLLCAKYEYLKKIGRL